ncbi:MAG: hypothetical protein NTZ26_00615 [Candidatus Aminicenantes bacterium]|nr:hypothetical protein [Candidatus Aminicenantes bacterium]
MRHTLPILIATVALLTLASCRAPQKAAPEPQAEAVEQETAGPIWRDILFEDLPLLGHRNWIVVADAAFPLQISPGMDVVVSGEDHFVVLDEVLKAVAAAGHVRPKIWLDKELDFVPEALAPGADAARKRLHEALTGFEVKPLLHEELIARLDQVAKTFRILMIKTNLKIPYTTVFMELDCGYWSPESEAKMREAMKGK